MSTQWIRKISLIVQGDTETLDLSEAHIKFQVRNADVESPNSASIRVYNLSKSTVKRLVSSGEFSSVILQAGYQSGDNFGVIFSGQLRQFRIGRDNATDTYVDILAADGDTFYNQGFVNGSVQGVSRLEELNRIAGSQNVPVEATLTTDKQHVVIPRGSVQFGMARARFREMVTTLDAVWSIQDGALVVHDSLGYRGGETVVLSSGTGLVGVPEQTNEGIKLQCLLNCKIRIGGLVQLDNSMITQLMQNDPNSANLAYDSWSNLLYNAALSDSGVYQAFVVEHEGDTRGDAWYSHLTCLATDQSAGIILGGL